MDWSCKCLSGKIPNSCSSHQYCHHHNHRMVIFIGFITIMLSSSHNKHKFLLSLAINSHVTNAAVTFHQIFEELFIEKKNSKIIKNVKKFLNACTLLPFRSNSWKDRVEKQRAAPKPLVEWSWVQVLAWIIRFKISKNSKWPMPSFPRWQAFIYIYLFIIYYFILLSKWSYVPSIKSNSETNSARITRSNWEWTSEFCSILQQIHLNFSTSMEWWIRCFWSTLYFPFDSLEKK